MLTTKQSLIVWRHIDAVLAKFGILPTHCILHGFHDNEQMVMEFDPFNDFLKNIPHSEPPAKAKRSKAVDTKRKVKPKKIIKKTVKRK